MEEQPKNSGITTITLEDNPMKNKHRKIKLNVKGDFKKWWGDHLLRRKVNSVGVDLHEVNHLSSKHVEVYVAGEMSDLWHVVNWAKRAKMFFRMNEILVEFLD